MKVLFNYKKMNKESTNFMWKEIDVLGQNTDIYIASAFFTNSDRIKKLLDNGCQIRLIIRLASGTSGKKLKEIINLKNVYIRFYTSNAFHPKMYIFGEQYAIIGSSNLTKSGLQTNQEANIRIESDTPVFKDIKIMFDDYWSYAAVLNNEILDKFITIEDKVEIAKRQYDDEVRKILEEVDFPNIDKDSKKKKKEELFRTDFERRYQIFISKHKELERIYELTEERKSNLPLRIEIDRFISWLRENKAVKETYLKMAIRSGESLEKFILENKKEYINYEDLYIIETENVLFPRILSVCKSEINLKEANEEELFEALIVVNAFKEQQRFFLGGLKNMKKSFFEENDINKIKEVLIYLIFGEGNYIRRIAEVINNEEYDIRHFSNSCIKELYGLVNNENIPICNERTFKSMQYLGFGNLS